MLDVMFEAPGLGEAAALTINRAVVRGEAPPLLRRKPPAAAAA
jgi:ATP-dependent protease Clp ATPase subunit